MTTYARAKRAINLTVIKVADAALVVAGFVLTYVVRDKLDQPDGVRSLIDLVPDQTVPFLVAPLTAYWWVIILAALYWPILQDQQRFYTQPLSLGWKRSLWMVVRTGIVILAGLLAIFFLTRVTWVNRTYVIGAIVCSVALIFIRHMVSLSLFRTKYKEGSLAGFPVLLVFPFSQAAEFIRLLKEHPEEYYEPAGLILMDAAPEGVTEVAGLPILGGLSELVRSMHVTSASGVIMGSKGVTLDLVRQVVSACETEGVDAWVMADFVQARTARAVSDTMVGREALVFTTSVTAVWQNAMKRMVDMVGASLALLLLGPVMVVVALAIRRTSPGPILFRQQRSGLHGKPFTMLKFRSMTSDAEMRKAELEMFNEMGGPVFKMAQDPRITPLGRVLRRWSLDELPQLFNVMAGDMSLVGPRPLPVYEVQKFDDPAHRRRLSMKPGLTCLWQIRGRNKVSDFNEWVRLDLEYIDRWSLWLDIKILLATPLVVLQGSGC